LLDPPAFNRFVFPEDEFELACLLQTNLFHLSHHVSVFKTAVELADYCDATRGPYRAKMLHAGDNIAEAWEASRINHQFVKWKQLAARDGAITLYNFAETKQVIDKQKAQCPTIFPHVDRKTLKRANVLFNKAFPGLADIRLSVAHAGKLAKSEEESARHRVPGSKVQITQMLADRRFSSSVNSKMASYDLTAESAAVLEAVTDEIYRAYAPAAEFTCGLPAQPYWEERIAEHRRRSEPPAQD
jgi:hypothetical protein